MGITPRLIKYHSTYLSTRALLPRVSIAKKSSGTISVKVVLMKKFSMQLYDSFILYQFRTYGFGIPPMYSYVDL